MTSKDNIPFHKPIKALLAFLLAWTVPGAGHAFVGRPVRGIIIFIVIGATFWAGIAMGGVMTVDRQEQKWWFAAEMLTGVHGLIGWQRESKQLQTLRNTIQAGMELERKQLEDKIRKQEDRHSEHQKQIAQIDRNIRNATSAEEKNTLKESRDESVKAKDTIREALIGYHSELNDLRSAHIDKVLAKERLVLVAPMATVARAYAGVAGLLNLMCMFDVLMLALIGTVVTTEQANKKGDQQ